MKFMTIMIGYDGTKVQLKPLKFATVDNKEYATEALLVCKWGGVLTSAGIKQARMTGMYRSQNFPIINVETK